uniref:Immunoglobulin domain-containing protein n=1 Tax=Dicentrarchus labrax TaxID=13489 RepID=A0A8C4H9P4_DICLA
MKADVLQDVYSVVWTFNKKDVLVRFSPGREPTVSPAYTGRVEFSVIDYSLKVKNLQEADSGVYTARVIRDIEEQTEYNVTVQGSSAVTPVFVQKGNDVLLNVEKADVLQDVFTVVWNFNKTDGIVRFSPGREPTVLSAYTGRVEFSVNDYSLKVKNLQEADSGVYTARVIGKKEESTEYNVTVQVSPVKLKVDSVSNSSDSCNLTVTCSTQDSHISSTFRCDTKTCSQEGGEQSEVTTSGASLHVYLVNHSIICNHSNQVSWTKDIEMAEHFCPQHAGSECVSAGISVCLVKTVVLSVGLIIMVSAVISVHIMEKLKKHK